MTLQWTETDPVGIGNVSDFAWTAQGQCHRYTIAERPGFDELPGFRELLQRWRTTVTADDGSEEGGWLSATVDEAKQRAEEYEHDHVA